MTITIALNGEPRQVAAGTTVAQLVTELDAGPRGVAVARNQEVVIRSEWARTPLVDGDRVDVLRAAQGG